MVTVKKNLMKGSMVMIMNNGFNGENDVDDGDDDDHKDDKKISGLVGLERLDLSHNKVSEIHPEAFLHLR